MEPNRSEVTQLLQQWSEGRQEALDRLLPQIYAELRRLAAGYLWHERRDHTLQATASNSSISALCGGRAALTSSGLLRKPCGASWSITPEPTPLLSVGTAIARSPLTMSSSALPCPMPSFWRSTKS